MEIQRIRGLVESACESPILLFLIDEMFSGTNSHDRRIAAETIARRLVESGAIGMITTHDLALARIADELNKQYTFAYESSRPPDGSWRNIRVHVTKGDYLARARRGYFAEKPPAS
jgi:DNA mismatch repair ATPase MutS